VSTPWPRSARPAASGSSAAEGAATKTLARSSDKAEILRRLAAVRPDSARRFGRMSAHQMICHLSDSFRAVMGRRPVSDGSSFLRRNVLKWLALYAPIHWPPGIMTRPEIDQEVGGTRPVEFAADVAELEALVEAITARPRAFRWQTHPTLGRMSESAWLRWSYLHMDHHLRQFGA
jgi:hypothetical protein